MLVLAPATAAAAAETSLMSTSPMVASFVKMGVQFWHAHGARPCEQPTVIRADLDSLSADGMAPLGGCVIYLNRDLVSEGSHERWSRHLGGDSMREALCTTVFHELGHTAGLEHTATGLMSITGGAVPWACHRWRLRQDSKARTAARRRHYLRRHDAGLGGG